MTAVAIPPAVPDLLGTSPADLIDRVIDHPVATLDQARKRAERVRAGLVSYHAMRQDIADAYACRDWVALDYGSWAAYVEGEFGTELRKLTRDERREAVRDLRTQGMSTRQIASATGIAQTQVVRDLAQVNTNGSPDARVTGADGKTYAATRPVDRPRPAERSAAQSEDGRLPRPGEGAKPATDAGVASERGHRAEDPRALVADALDKHAPQTEDDRWRPWRLSLLADIQKGHAVISRQTVDEVIERADDECVAELLRLADEIAAYAARVREGWAARYGTNVVPLRRDR